MNRTALRLAVLAALTAGGNAPFPTLAGAGVFDSRQDPIEDLAADERRPVIVLRTGEDRRGSGTPSQAGAGLRTARTCELAIEIGVVTAAADENGVLVVGWPETDNQLEAVLDVLEYQVEMALWGETAWAVWFRSLPLGSLVSTVSNPIYTEPTSGRVRLAAREIVLTVQLAVDARPRALRASDPMPAAALPDGIALVFAKIEADGAGDVKAAAAQLKTVLDQQTWPRGGVFPDLAGANLTVEGGTEDDDTTVEATADP